MTKRKKMYDAWKDMWRRAEGKLSPERYKNRGIKVCKRWRNFETFLQDMGEPSTLKHTLDRIDSNGNYEPSNCRWATWQEQALNRNPRVLIETLSGESVSLIQACKLYNLKANSVAARVYASKGKITHQEVFNEYIFKKE